MPVRFLVMWAPVTVVSIASGIYLFECADTFLAPGTGFTFDYGTPVGPLKIECDNYSVDLLQQAIIAKNLRIRREDGTMVARVPQLVAKGIAIDDGLSPKVQIKDAEIWVNRDVKGDLDILKFLTPSEGGASEQPWQISLRDSTIHLRDWTAVNGVRNDIRISTGNFAGMGDDTEGAVQVEASGLAKGVVSFKKTADGTVLSARSVEAKIGPVLNRLRMGMERRSLKDIEPLHVDGGQLIGDFELRLPRKGQSTFQSTLSAEAPAARWADIRAEGIHIKGSLNDQGFVGDANATSQGMFASISGSLNYSHGLAFGGNVKASGVQPKHLALLKFQLPKDVSFARAGASGYLTYRDGKIGWKGNALVEAPTALGLRSPKIAVDLGVQGNELLAVLHPTTVGKTSVAGRFAYNFKTQAIAGSVNIPQANGSDFSQWLPAALVQSNAEVDAIIDGTIAKPAVYVKGSIDPRIKLTDRMLDLNRADVVLRFDGQKFLLDRFALNDSTGKIYATGSIDLKKGIDVRIVGNDVDLAKLANVATGKVDLQGHVVGTLSDPHYAGKVQGFGIGYSGMPGKILAVATDFSGTRSSVKFRDIEAMDGASQITGSIGIGLKDQQLGGNFAVHGIDIRDLYDGPVGGVLDLNDVIVSGTLGSPLVQGSFEAKKLLAYNYAIDSAKGFVNYDGNNFHISNGSANFANGSVSNVASEFSSNNKNGKISGTFEKIDLNEVSQSALRSVAESDGGSQPPVSASNLAVKGTTSGNFQIGIENGAFASLVSKGRVDDVTLNKALIGSGDWDARFEGKAWNVNAFIGSLDEYFRIDGGTYTPETDAIGGEFLSYQIPVQELLVAAEPSLGLTPENLERMHQFNGKLGAYVQFSGTSKNPSVDISDLEISSIKLGDTDLGNFSIKGTYANRDFSFRDGLLQGPKNGKVLLPFGHTITLPDRLAIPDGTAKLAGTIKDTGEINVAGSIYGFPVSKFAAVVPSLENVDLHIDQANFNLKGTRERPVLQSDLSATAGLTPNGKRPESGILSNRLQVNAKITASPASGADDRAIEIASDGDFHLSTIQGTLGARLYLDSNFAISQDAPFAANIKLDGDRDVSAFFKGIDDLSFGDDGVKLSGGLEVGNNLRNKTFSGGLQLKTDSVQYGKVQEIIGKPIDLVLKDLTLQASIQNDPKAGYQVKTTASAKSNYSKGEGGLTVDTTVSLGDFTKQKPNDKGWKSREIFGKITAKNFGIYQSFPQGSFVQATVDTGDQGPMNISGTLEKPKIAGDVYFSNVKTIVPTLNPTQSSSETSSLDPSFDIRFYAKEPMNIKASLAEVNAKGDGTLKGTLSNMKADGELNVESGSLTLPGGNVKLSPDGTLKLRYESTPYSNRAQLVANLHGETALTALKNGVTPERYDISLDINGDLLSRSNGLSLTASSQPGDLSQDRILQLLGRTDILTNFLQSGVNSNVESELKSAFASFALPSVLNGLTTDIARSFKLDYFGVDYNVFEQASLSFVKGLGGGFFLQGRQQLFQPLPGQPLAYDFRLAYRPRRGPNSIRALSFSLGTDQLRPYKLSIDFTNRIRTRKAPYQTIKLHVPNK